MATKKFFGKRFFALLATLALLISMVAMVGSFAVSAESSYSPKRVVSYTAGGTQIEGKLLITGSGSKFGAGKEVTVKGYVKVENYVAKNDTDHNVQVGAGGGATGGLAIKEDCDWTPFELKYTTGDGNWLKFGFWYAQGTMSIADVTFEDADGNVIYDMATDADLVAGTYDASAQPATMGMWYIGYYGDKSEISCTVDPVYVAPYVPQRVMSYTAGGTQIEGKMLITGSGSKFGAGKEVTVKGYYKIENYVAKNDTDHCVQIGSLSPKADCDWTPFELKYTTGDGNWLKFGFWYAQGTLSIADITFVDADGKVIYDMATDTALVGGTYDASAQPATMGMWYIGYYGDKSEISCTIDPAYVAPYSPKRVMSYTAGGTQIEGKMLVTGSGSKFGAGKEVTVKGYAKVENYVAKNDTDHCVQVGIGGGATGGLSIKEDCGWTPFELKYTTGDSNWLKFGFWYAQGTLSIADVTFEDAEGNVIYNMATDADLVAGTYDAAAQPATMGMWYIGFYGDKSEISCTVGEVVEGGEEEEEPDVPVDIGVIALPTVPDMMAPDANGYAPNRAFGIISTVDANPYVTWAVWGDNFVDADKYYIFANVQVSGFQAFEGATDAGCSISLLAGEYSAVLGNWTADTNGWVALEDAEGKPFSFDKLATIDDSVVLTFETKNAAANFMVGDLIIADCNGNIIYSLANDKLLDLENDMRYTTSTDWNAVPFVANPDGPSLFPIRTKGHAEYVPNVSLSIAPKAWTPGHTPENSIIIRTNAAPFVAGETYTIRGKILVDVLEGFQLNANPRADFTAHTLGPIGSASICDTDGWVSLVYPNGDPIVFKGTADLDYVKFNLYMTHGVLGLADIVILDSQGNVVYDMSKDEGVTGVTEPITNEGWFDLGEIWRIALYGEEYSSCIVSVNENPTEYTDADYDVPTFEETVTIPSGEVEEEEDVIPPTSGMSILLMAALATMSAGGAAVLSLKKKEN